MESSRIPENIVEREFLYILYSLTACYLLEKLNKGRKSIRHRDKCESLKSIHNKKSEKKKKKNIFLVNKFLCFGKIKINCCFG